MCLAQGLNDVTPVRLKPATSRSRNIHSSTESLRPGLNPLAKAHELSPQTHTHHDKTLTYLNGYAINTAYFYCLFFTLPHAFCYY